MLLNNFLKKTITTFFVIFLISIVSCGPFGLSEIIEENNVKWTNSDSSFYFIDIEVPGSSSINGFGEYVIDGEKYQIYADGVAYRPFLSVYIYDSDYSCLGYIRFIMKTIRTKMKLNKSMINLELQNNSTKFVAIDELFSISKFKVSENDIYPLDYLLSSYCIDNNSFELNTNGRSISIYKIISNYYYGIHFYNYTSNGVETTIFLRWEPNNKGVFYSSFDEKTGILASKIAEYDYVILNSNQIKLDRREGFLPESLILTVDDYEI